MGSDGRERNGQVLMRKARNIEGMPVMPKRCKTCPFNENGCKEVRDSVMGRLLEVSQTCHSTGVALNPPRKDTHLCRGARDVQIEFFYRMGFLEEASDTAWFSKLAEVKQSLDKSCGE